MSSISGSDRSRQTDELRRMREEYENNEAESAKRQRKEVRRLTKKHSEEVKDLQSTYEGRLDAVREKSRNTLSDRDEDHRVQTEKIREMYREQLRRKTEDNEQTMGLLRETNKSEVEKQKLISEQQRNNLENNHKSTLANKDQEYADFAHHARETIKDSITERTQDLNKRHAVEMEAVTSDRDRRLVEANNNQGQQKSYLEGKMKDMERRHSSERNRLQDNYLSMAREQSVAMDEALTGRSETLQHERANLRAEFSEAQDQQNQKFNELRENLKDQSQERIDREIRSAQNQLRQIKADSLAKNSSNNRQHKIEKQNLVNQYEDRIRDLEKQKTETTEVANNLARRRVTNEMSKADRVLQASNRQSRMTQDLILQRSREDRANLESEMKFKVDAEAERADKRVARVTNMTREAQVREAQYFKDNTAQMKSNFSDELSAQREAQLNTLTNIRIEMKDKLRSQELKAQSRLEQTVANYEERIKNMEDAHAQELARMKTGYESRLEQRDQGQKMESQQLIQKYEMRLSDADQTHQREMERLQRRNEEGMANLASRLNSTKKKV